MTLTSDRPALLRICIQDLHAGKRMLAERLGGIARHATDPALRERLLVECVAATGAAERLADTGVDVDGPDNLWMAGILDDAERDTRSHDRGALLDTALVGAIRKAKAAEIVSAETAIALADALALDEIAGAVRANHAEDSACDARLRECLHAIVPAR